MRTHFSRGRFLTERRLEILFSFTLFLAFFALTHPVLATDEGMDTADDKFLWVNENNNTNETPLEADERHRRVKLLLNYVRTEGPKMVPGLPALMNTPSKWAMQSLNAIRDEFGISSSNIDHSTKNDTPSLFATIVQPMSNFLTPPGQQQNEAFWASPDYHHKGFLPTHDAMIMGFNVRHSMGGGALQIDTHPFYGQNWHNPESYWGVESSINLTRTTADHENVPWGKISIRYANGDDELMDRSRGVDMDAELKFDNQLSLHAGFSRDESTAIGNYVLLRWQLMRFDP